MTPTANAKKVPNKKWRLELLERDAPKNSDWQTRSKVENQNPATTYKMKKYKQSRPIEKITF